MSELPYRQIHMDFHTSPYIKDIGAKFDAREFVDTLKNAYVDSINLFAKCHHGMYYYPTKIGTMHPFLKFDLLGEQVRACRENGIRVAIYTTAGWNEDWADRHPEWMQVGIDGTLGVTEPFSDQYYTWRYLCLNNKEYKQLLKEELAEIYERYRPDAFWIDIVIQNGCTCKACLQSIREAGFDPRIESDVRKNDRLVEIAFMKEFFEYCKQLDGCPDVYFNGSPSAVDLVDAEEYSAESKRRYNSFLDIESLPSDLWGYTHFPIAASYLHTKDKEITMMNGRFHMAWGDFGGLRNQEALEYECFRGLAQGAKCCVGDQLHPSGRIDAAVYERIGAVYKSVRQKEKWCRGTSKLAQIGVYLSNLAMEETNAANEGTYRILTESHHAFDFIDYTADIDKYELVILPDSVRLGQSESEKIDAYLQGGGKVLLTAKSGLCKNQEKFALRDLKAVYKGASTYCPRYIRTDDTFFPGILPMDYVIYEKGESIEAAPGTETLAGIVDPYFNRTYDRFCSHRQTPPVGEVSEPGIIRCGNVIYCSSPLFRDYALNGGSICKQLICRCIDMLLPSKMLVSDLPNTAEVALRRQESNIVLHILHYIPVRKCRKIDIIDTKIPLYDISFSVRCEVKPEAIYLAPQEEKIAFDYSEGRARFRVAKIDGHQMIMIKM